MATRTERACLVCGIVRTFNAFCEQGCPNCDSLLSLQNSEENVHACTSPSFEGLVAMSEPEKSWVARWLRIDGFQPGTYAVKVNGRLPEEIVQSLDAQGVRYRPRDGSVQD
ncbi:Spt4/RpoE2 zinc finger-domain-containing protein [Lipomyces tetrasporus]|uniref:Transcription elongation factor SPT4 n=1 Tax=Lipomyces tetrasporus TaxID=54092 RepID=A0AAD7QL15_9ASCO|nr:Spt4/RpoE2 zinc finger-domain-containing protein [Lipomyces tetrasporus]KAJ8096816.1 Spt4/RpoE2 zinc finger-domain-containing protein [Lipomyces tetrasporus]